MARFARSFVIVAAVLVAATSSTSNAAIDDGLSRENEGVAEGARPARTRMLVQHPITLAQLEDVAGELKLSDEQKKKIAELADEMQQERQAIFQSAAGDFDMIRREMNDLNAQMEDELNEALDESQRKRIKEIYVQVNGPAVLQNAKMVAELKLDDEQKSKLETAMDEARTRMFGAFQEFQSLSPEDRETRQNELADERDAAYLAVLSDEQKKSLEEMKGEKFDADLSKIPDPFQQR